MKFSGKVGNEQMVKLRWRFGSRIRIRIRIRIATLIRRALAEVCTVPVLLVIIIIIIIIITGIIIIMNQIQNDTRLYW